MLNKNTIQHTYQEVGHLKNDNFKSKKFMILNILLNFKIKRLRKKLVEMGIKKGLNHPDTLRYSQRLDKLIIKSLFLT